MYLWDGNWQHKHNSFKGKVNNNFKKLFCFCFFFIFIIIIFFYFLGFFCFHSMQVWRATMMRAWSYKKKSTTRLWHTENLFRTENLHAVKRCLLILDLKPFRQMALYRQLYRQNFRVYIAVWERKLLWHKDTCKSGDRKVMQSAWAHMRIRQWNQFSQFWWTSTKVLPKHQIFV